MRPSSCLRPQTCCLVSRCTTTSSSSCCGTKPCGQPGIATIVPAGVVVIPHGSGQVQGALPAAAGTAAGVPKQLHAADTGLTSLSSPRLLPCYYIFPWQGTASVSPRHLQLSF